MGLLRPARQSREGTVSSSLQGRSGGRFRPTFEKTPVGLAHVSPDGRWLEVNERLCTILGYSRDRLLATTFQDLTHPDDLGPDLEKLEAMLAAEIDCYSIEKRYLRADGSSVWCNLTVSLIWTPDGMPDHFIAAVEDVSARRALEQRLAELQQTLEAKVAERTIDLSVSEVRYRLLAENANEMIARMATDGTVLYVSPSVQQVLGYCPDEVVGRTTMSLTHPADIPSTLAMFAGLVAAGPGAPGRSYEFRGRHKDGRWVWLEGQPKVVFDDAGQVVAFHDVVRDVSCRKEVEEALRLSQAFLSRTSSVAGVGGWEFDPATNEVMWSEQTCLLHDVEPGYRPSLEDAIAFYEPEARPVILDAVRRGLETGVGWDLELPMVSARGRRFWARAFGAAEFVDGRPVRLVGAFQDVSERRRMSRELVERQELLRVTLESIGDAVITVDAAGTVTWLNPEAERLAGCGGGEAIGRPLQDVAQAVEHGSGRRLTFPRPERQRCALPRNMALLGRSPALDIDGTVAPVLEPSRGCLGHVIVFRDVSDERRRERDLQYQATHDPLTGLLNRRSFEQLLMDEIGTKSLSGALLFLDLDGFKQINDAFGHQAGDRVLRQVAEILRAEALRSASELVARLGGDEFAILLDCAAYPCGEHRGGVDWASAGGFVSPIIWHQFFEAVDPESGEGPSGGVVGVTDPEAPVFRLHVVGDCVQPLFVLPQHFSHAGDGEHVAWRCHA